MFTLALILTAILGLATGYPSLYLFSFAALLMPMLSIATFVVIAGGLVLYGHHKFR